MAMGWWFVVTDAGCFGKVAIFYERASGDVWLPERKQKSSPDLTRSNPDSMV
jgi:hypothetical protein